MEQNGSCKNLRQLQSYSSLLRDSNMPQNEVKPNCHTCQHRRPALGSTHSSCKHPWVTGDNAAFAQNMVIKTGSCRMTDGDQELYVEVGEHGIMNGWANWPVEYDPIWVKGCSGYKIAGFKMYSGEVVPDQDILSERHGSLYGEPPKRDAILADRDFDSAVVFDGKAWRKLDLGSMQKSVLNKWQG